MLHLPSRESPQALAKVLLQEHEDSVLAVACQKVVSTCVQLDICALRDKMIRLWSGTWWTSGCGSGFSNCL